MNEEEGGASKGGSRTQQKPVHREDSSKRRAAAACLEVQLCRNTVRLPDELLVARGASRVLSVHNFEDPSVHGP